jgi:hypothetical protein
MKFWLIPEKCGRPRMYPFQDLPVGGTLLVNKIDRKSAKACAAQWQRRVPGMRFASADAGHQIQFTREA